MKKDLNLQIGERVRCARKEVGFSRDELAEMLGISSLFLSYIECGQRGMSLSTLMNLCKILQVSADYILFGSENETGSENDLLQVIKSIEPEYRDLVFESINNLKKIIAITKDRDKI